MNTGPADYRAAVSEFDRLWESGAAGRHPERMQQLLQVIDAVEAAPLRACLEQGREGLQLDPEADRIA